MKIIDKLKRMWEKPPSSPEPESEIPISVAVLEIRAMQFMVQINRIIYDGSQKSVDTLFSALDSLSLKPGFRLGLKIAGKTGIGGESCFYTYRGDDALGAAGYPVPLGKDIFKNVIVEHSAMGVWQAYLLYISPTIMPTWWHGCYSNRKFFFARMNYKGVITDCIGREVEIEQSQIPQPTVEMRDGKAVVSCPYWNDWKGLVLETVDIEFKSDGTVALTPHSKVLYKYDCGVCL